MFHYFSLSLSLSLSGSAIYFLDVFPNVPSPMHPYTFLRFSKNKNSFSIIIGIGSFLGDLKTVKTNINFFTVQFFIVF